MSLPYTYSIIRRHRRQHLPLHQLQITLYDGEYGVIRVFAEGELRERRGGKALFDDEAIPSAKPARRKASKGSEQGADEAKVENAETTIPRSPKGAPERAEKSVDAAQAEAIACTEGPLLIVAGPGTGKTRTLTQRIASLVRDKGVPAASCLALTFTRRAAEEMQHRLQALLGPEAESLTLTTFHGLGRMILQEERVAAGLHRSFTILNASDSEALVADLFALSTKAAKKQLEGLTQRKRESLLGIAPKDPALDEALERYRHALWERDALDYDDLLLLPLERFREEPALARRYSERWRYISVDEYQDIDALQYRLLRALCSRHDNLCVIGDPDQSIYSFRGAEVGFFLRFQEDFPGARHIQLQRNYRSSATIVQAALQAIAPSTLVAGRKLEAMASGPASPIVLYEASSTADEADFILRSIEKLLGGTSHYAQQSAGVERARHEERFSFSDIAILYRSRSQSRALVQALHEAGFPYRRYAHQPLLAHPEVLALCEAMEDAEAQGERPAEVLERAIESRRLAIEGLAAPNDKRLALHALDSVAPAMRSLATTAESLHDLHQELVTRTEADLWDPRAEGISLLTLHAAKGLEFPVVFIVGLEEGRLPLHWGAKTHLEVDKSPLDEERRLFFVGITRAKERLHLSYARAVKGGLGGEPSRFLSEISQGLLHVQKNAASGAEENRFHKRVQLSLL